MLWWFILGFIPVLIGRGALEAMKAPRDRWHLARQGLTTTLNFTFAIGASFAFVLLVKVVACYLMPQCAAVDSTLYMAGSYGIGLMILAMLSSAKPRTLLTLSLLGSAALIVLLAALFWGPFGTPVQPKVIGFTSLVFIFPLLLNAVAGALFTWMERPPQKLG
jgi:hypothetical protein